MEHLKKNHKGERLKSLAKENPQRDPRCPKQSLQAWEHAPYPACAQREKKRYDLTKSYINNTTFFVGFFSPLSLFLFLDCFEIDNFTDPAAKNCCSVSRICWMPFGRTVCLPKIIHVCWGHKNEPRGGDHCT